MRFNVILALFVLIFISSCTLEIEDQGKDVNEVTVQVEVEDQSRDVNEVTVQVEVENQDRDVNGVNDIVKTDNKEYELATFSGGCFWCSEKDFEKHEGVIEVISGYAGGEEENPTYKEVSSGNTGHREAISVRYNPEIISYEELLEIYWRHIDPTDDSGSFVDRGFQYTSAIYYHNEMQKELAEKSKKELEDSKKFDKQIVTPIIEFTTFYTAEEYHQDYYKKNPIRYKFYRSGSGRDDFIEENWKEGIEEETETKLPNNWDEYEKPDEEELKEELSPLSYDVTQNDATERPFDNKYNDNKEEGIYVDIVSGEPLYSSTDKYDSKTGWPSFTKPLNESHIVLKKDYKLIIPRTEVRSKYADSHLGHLFNDGPVDKGGKRYCMNSAAMRFIPKEEMEKEGYGHYLYLFE